MRVGLLALLAGSAKALVDSSISTADYVYQEAGVNCGILLGNDRVIGGEFVANEEFPWMVYMYICDAAATEPDDDLCNNCGGTVLSMSWILTAGSCVNQDVTGTGLKLDYPTYGRVGRNAFEDLGFIDGVFTANIEFIDALIHDAHFANLDNNAKDKAHDAALMKYRSADPEYRLFGVTVFPICLTPPEMCLVGGTLDDPTSGMNVQGVGWGYTETPDTGEISQLLNKVDLPIIQNEECATVYKPNTVLQHATCAGGVAGEGLCVGDAGGPSQYETVNNDTSVFFQYGIVCKFGRKRHCAEEDEPIIFSRVNSIIEWITNTTGVFPTMLDGSSRQPFDSDGSTVFENTECMDSNFTNTLVTSPFLSSGPEVLKEVIDGRNQLPFPFSDTTIDNLSKIGCWCPTIGANPSSALKGMPLDDYDLVCKKLATCEAKAYKCDPRCKHLDASSTVQFSLDVDPSNGSTRCQAFSECGDAICACQVAFAEAMSQLLESELDGQPSSQFVDVTEDQCIARQPGNGNGSC